MFSQIEGELYLCKDFIEKMPSYLKGSTNYIDRSCAKLSATS